MNIYLFWTTNDFKVLIISAQQAPTIRILNRDRDTIHEDMKRRFKRLILFSGLGFIDLYFDLVY